MTHRCGGAADLDTPVGIQQRRWAGHRLLQAELLVACGQPVERLAAAELGLAAPGENVLGADAAVRGLAVTRSDRRSMIASIAKSGTMSPSFWPFTSRSGATALIEGSARRPGKPRRMIVREIPARHFFCGTTRDHRGFYGYAPKYQGG